MLTQKAINITLDRHNFKVHMHDEPFHVLMNLHTRTGFRKIDSGLKGLIGFLPKVISDRIKKHAKNQIRQRLKQPYGIKIIIPGHQPKMNIIQFQTCHQKI